MSYSSPFDDDSTQAHSPRYSSRTSHCEEYDQISMGNQAIDDKVLTLHNKIVTIVDDARGVAYRWNEAKESVYAISEKVGIVVGWYRKFYPQHAEPIRNPPDYTPVNIVSIRATSDAVWRSQMTYSRSRTDEDYVFFGYAILAFLVLGLIIGLCIFIIQLFILGICIVILVLVLSGGVGL
ncbi:hypothetical protein QCA50_019567 [Cerrena zonata]|uniref:Uncharacterized protein n=1 Tax=Cerrena zonata TaxID=2478898 RepID=A0AAW0FH19_9APHY